MCYKAQVLKTSAAFVKRAGLEPGMEILSVNGREVTDLATLQDALRTPAPMRPVKTAAAKWRFAPM